MLIPAKNADFAGMTAKSALFAKLAFGPMSSLIKAPKRDGKKLNHDPFRKMRTYNERTIVQLRKFREGKAKIGSC